MCHKWSIDGDGFIFGFSKQFFGESAVSLVTNFEISFYMDTPEISSQLPKVAVSLPKKPEFSFYMDTLKISSQLPKVAVSLPKKSEFSFYMDTPEISLNL